MGPDHLLRWDRIAVVTDLDWIRHAVSAFGFLISGRARVFTLDRQAEARRWIAAPATP